MQHGCDAEFAEENVKAYGSEDIFKKYVRFKMNINVDMDPNLRWCPRNGCLNFVKRRGRFHRRATCVCGQVVCMRCGAADHGRVRCANVGDREFHEFARDNNLKPCPKCKISTLKYEGCNHITCQKCHYEWCWVCFGAYRVPGGHYNGLVFLCPGSQFGNQNICWTLTKIIAIIIFAPVVLLFGPMLAGLIGPFGLFCNRDCPFLVNLILFAMAWPLAIALGILCGILAFCLLTIPIEFINIVRLFRLSLA